MKIPDETLPEPAIRTIDDMRTVLRSPSFVYDQPLYFMYREVARCKNDQRWMQSHAIRYDITIIPPANIDGEYVKTKGHYHPENSAGIGYPEIYDVVEGTAHFLLQKKDLSDIVLITAVTGDVVIIPPGYGHVTINPDTDTTLTMSNLVSTRFSSEYAFYESKHGAAYYELVNQKFEKNPHYPVVPPLRKVKSKDTPLAGFGSFNCLYDCVGNKHIADLLNSPEKFMEFFK